MQTAIAIRITALYGATGVALGAFGAHSLEEKLTSSGRLDTWETATVYLLVHTVAMLVSAVANPPLQTAWRLFASGSLIFSGSLYLLCLTGLRWLGAITPIGGVLLLAAWIFIAIPKTQSTRH